MGEPWGPPKRRLTKLDEWVGAWPTDIANHYIHADWYGPSPIYTQNNFAVITAALATDGTMQQIVDPLGRVTEFNSGTINSALGKLARNPAMCCTYSDMSNLVVQRLITRPCLLYLKCSVSCDQTGRAKSACSTPPSSKPTSPPRLIILPHRRQSL